jgi:hypothetical protein
MTDLLGEPRHFPPCPMNPPLSGGARAQTLPPASYHRAVGEPGTTPPRTRPARRDHAMRAESTGGIRGWTGLPGRGPASLSADWAWQATGPRTVVTGRFRLGTVR